MSQREYMQMLFKRHGDNEDILVREYAEAEMNGIVRRKRNQNDLDSIKYARALYKDGMKKGWIRNS